MLSSKDYLHTVWGQEAQELWREKGSWLELLGFQTAIQRGHGAAWGRKVLGPNPSHPEWLHLSLLIFNGSKFLRTSSLTCLYRDGLAKLSENVDTSPERNPTQILCLINNLVNQISTNPLVKSLNQYFTSHIGRWLSPQTNLQTQLLK